MKSMVMVRATPSSEAGVMPSEQLQADMGRYNEELVPTGVRGRRLRRGLHAELAAQGNAGR